MTSANSIQHDRQRFSVLVVVAKSITSGQLRQSLKTLGFTQVSVVPTHIAALERVKGRNFTHIMFDAKATDMPAIEFVSKMMEIEKEAIMIAVSEEPKIDDVFGLLRAGARAFLVPPLTLDMIEQMIVQASEGPQLSEAVLNAPDRNAAFVAVILNNLYRLSVSMRQSREFKSAERDVKVYNYSLRESVEMAQIFCEGGDDDLREKIMEGCVNRAKDASTRLGRLRKKLKKERAEDGVEETSPPPAANRAQD
jgi:DNA-binding NarL/FixJ family response regulator